MQKDSCKGSMQRDPHKKDTFLLLKIVLHLFPNLNIRCAMRSRCMNNGRLLDVVWQLKGVSSRESL